MKLKRALIFIALLVQAITVRPAQATLQYIVLDLGTLPGGTASGGYGINSSGQVTGNSDYPGIGQHTFLYAINTGMMDHLVVLRAGAMA